MNNKLIPVLLTLAIFSIFTLGSVSAHSYAPNDYYKKTTSYEINSEPYYDPFGQGKRTITTRTTVKDYGTTYGNGYNSGYYPRNNYYPGSKYYRANDHYPQYSNWRHNRAYNYNDYRNPYNYDTTYNRPYYYEPRCSSGYACNWRY